MERDWTGPEPTSTLGLLLCISLQTCSGFSPGWHDTVAVNLTWGWILCLFATGARAMCDCLLGPRSSPALTPRRRHSGTYLIPFCTHSRLPLSRPCNVEVTPNANQQTYLNDPFDEADSAGVLYCDCDCFNTLRSPESIREGFVQCRQCSRQRSAPGRYRRRYRISPIPSRSLWLCTQYKK